jgi:hypothetical protein
MTNYGCGNDGCVGCYPLQYSCADCGTKFEQPIPNAQTKECLTCGYINNPKWSESKPVFLNTFGVILNP